MLLAIDIGNTNTVFGVFNGLDLLVNWRTETAADRQLDEWGIQIISIMKYFKLCPDQITGIIISSVVPTLMWNFNRMANRYFKIDPMIVSPEIKTDIKIMLDNPQEVGADRIVNATAAYNRYKNAVIVVDFGTATTFDSISHRGEYCGGVITPGFNISMDALFGNA